MTQRIDLSRTTQGLIAKLKKKKQLSSHFLKTFNLETTRTVEKERLLTWLAQDLENQEDERIQILLTALNASLLNDLARFLTKTPNKAKSKEKLSPYRKVQKGLFYLLTVVGTILFACDGFDGITLIVSVLPLSPAILFVVGLAFAIISILAFHAFDLTEIARNLKISRKKAGKLVDNYLKEVAEINKIRREINSNYIKCKSIKEMEENIRLTELLLARYKALDKGRDALIKQTDNQKFMFTKYLITSLIGIIYFSYGFFAGQALATAIAAIFVASTAPLFWPIFAASFVVGLAAFAVYWFVERPSIDKLVGHWFGLDKVKLEYLCDAEKIESHQNKLEGLKANLCFRKNLLTNDLEKKTNYHSKLQEALLRIKELKRSSGELATEKDFGFFSTAEQLKMPFFLKKTLALREKTQSLIEQLKDKTTSSESISNFLKPKTSEQIKQTKLIKWLSQTNQTFQRKEDQSDEDLQLLSASLNTALMKDLAISLRLPSFQKKQKKTTSKYNSFYLFLGFVGTVYFGCQGFEGMTSLLSMFSIPKAAILVVGAVFGLISIISFQAFDLAEIAKNLGIKKKNVHKLVDLYLKEVKSIKAIRHSLDSLYAQRTTPRELDEDLQLSELLIARYNKLDEERQSLTTMLAAKKLTVLKYLMSTLVGVIYFSMAFFTGQAVALAIAGLFVVGTAPLSWPIVLVSSLLGIAAFAVYWYVERPSIEKLVSSIFGLDQDKIGRLCNPKKVEEEKAKLELLRANLISCKEYMMENAAENADYETQLKTAEKQLKELAKTAKPEKSSYSEEDSRSSDYFFNTTEPASDLLTNENNHSPDFF